MVSLRRKKFKFMDDGCKRRSARLLAIEEVKNGKAVLALPVDFRQLKGNEHTNLQKRGRKKTREFHKETQTAQEAENINDDQLNCPSASSNSSKQVIGYILDMFEVRDEFDLFSVPHNLQTYDFEENISKPGHFAMLRQKFTDGMYTSLELFEIDLLTLFGKAIDSNAPNSTPFKEATTMRDVARQIFQSLKNNLTHTELELANWHQNYFKYKRRVLRNEGNVGILSQNAQTSSSYAVSTDLKKSSGVIDVAANGRPQSWNEKQTTRRTPQSRANSRPRRSRVAAPTVWEQPKSPDEQRRFSYKAANGPNDSLFTMAVSEPRTLYYNRNTLSYKESLRLFVKDAGPSAKFIAEKKCVEYNQRVDPQSIWKPPPFGSLSKIGALSQAIGDANSSVVNNYGPSDNALHNSEEFDHLSCPLQTNQMLTLFSLIGTPEFLRRNSGLRSEQNPACDSKWRFGSLLHGMAATQNGVRFVPQTSEGKKYSQHKAQPAIWQQQQLSGSNPRLATEVASPPSAATRDCYEHGKYPWKPINLN